MELLKKKFQEYGQEHVFRFASSQSEEQLQDLFKDLSEINLQEVKENYNRAKSGTSQTTATATPKEVKPFPNVCLVENTQKERKSWEKLGLQKINEGKTAVLLLAGGQGTRLGTVNPKGMYDIGLPSHKSLFQIQAERIVKIQQIATNTVAPSKDSIVPWYIMTSESTKGMTISYFEQNKYFGLDSKNIFFFEQAMIPCISPEGKIIMETPCKVARAPNGNGGLYSALVSSGALADMETRGVEMVLVYGVDNCLIKMADPVFFGYCFEKELDCAAKVVSKAYPEEPVGVVALIDGKPGVIEYSEIDKEIAHLQDPTTGKLMYNAAHVCMNMFSVPFLKKVCTTKLKSLPFHIAKKKIPAVNDIGQTVAPDNINGWKLEMFIFDVFEFSEHMGAFEVLRNEEFSPLKNGPESDVDSPSSCKRQLSALHRSWLEKAGGILPNSPGPNICEVSALVSYNGEGLESLVKGKTFDAFPISL